MAVKQKYFEKKIGVQCHNEECRRIITVVDTETEVPNIVECDVCKELERGVHVFHPVHGDLIEFYKLANKHDDRRSN